MKFLEEVKKSGYIPSYDICEDIDNLLMTYDKPSARGLRTKIGRKTLALLRKINKENNHSWYKEIRDRAEKKGMNDIALFYRGNKITYREMFDKADQYAKSLIEIGVKAGDEIPCCLSNTPELVYLMLAASRLGVCLNLFGTNLDKDYLSSILNSASKKAIFVSDVNYSAISDVINQKGYANQVIVSLADSLPKDPRLCDEYEPDLDKYYHYDNKLEEIKKINPDAISVSQFANYGSEINLEDYPDVSDLNTIFTVTYSSGSTRRGFPKQIMHRNSSYIIGGIYNDTNLTGSPSVPEIRGLAHIHPDSNTNLVTCISDNLLKHGSVALEPEYDPQKFLDYIILNKPVHLDATTSFLVAAAKQYLIERRFHEDGKGKKLPYLLVAMAVGEKTSPGEEKLINRFLREASAGSQIKLNGITLPYAPMSMGGGDCEHGGIFYTLLKNLQRLKNITKIGKAEFGMTPVPFSVVTALKLNDDGEYEECDYGEYGLIVANSVTSMAGYKGNHEKTVKKIIRDRYGRDWLSCDTYGYINKLGNVIVKGRVEDVIKDCNGNEIPCFMIDDAVSKDSKNILSCSTIRFETESGDIPVVNIEISPLSNKSTSRILHSLYKRCADLLPERIVDSMVFRIIDSSKGFPLSGSGKRDILQLENMELINTFKIVNGELIPFSLQEKAKQNVKY